MEKLPDIIEPLTPKLPYNRNPEDSGYHSSFTPGFFEYSARTEECNRSIEFPYNRRGIKRSYPEEIENTYNSYSCISTPTSNISGELDILRLSDSKKRNTSITSCKSYSNPTIVQHSDSYNNDIIPTTPLKRICKSDCKLNSPKRSHKLKIDFNLVMHSIGCEKAGLLSKVKPLENKPNSFNICNVKPHQKIDIIKMLHQNGHDPALLKIFSYLNHEDIFIFTLVSQYWQKVWEYVGKSKTQEEHRKYLNDKKESQENRMSTPKTREHNRSRPLMEIQNLCYKNVPTNPSVSPKTMKYKRFMETGTNGLQKQLKCMRCGLPAKIILETSGEEWAECIGSSCSFQFCSSCKCPRHPGKNCIRFDLNCPSPSKRILKNKCVAATKESRKKLGRLKF